LLYQGGLNEHPRRTLLKETIVVKVLFVCLGNICRSPLAEGLFRHRALEAGLEEGLGGAFLADSAGTGSWHVGNPPDIRSVAVARKYGIDISAQRGRQIEPSDFSTFDYILAMDRDNLSTLQAQCPPEHQEKVSLLLSHAPDTKLIEVPDPYFFRDDAGFERIFSVIGEGVDGLLARLKSDHFS
jgi:protein-tyrosine phosphatase